MTPAIVLGLGCMRFGTAPDRDDERSIATIHAALEGGAALLDTAGAYAHDERDAGHSERLIARALASWSGTRPLVYTKGGIRREGGAWVPDGRARHLREACEASLEALGVDRLDGFQLHAVDPRVDLATSVRAMAALQREGLVASLGLSNVVVRQIEEALALAPIAGVQIELSPLRTDALRNGVAELCAKRGLQLLAYRPLGGPQGAAKLARDPLLRELAASHGVSPHAIALAWILSLGAIPLAGATRPETARDACAALRVALSEDERARLTGRFLGATAAPPVQAGADGEVVLLMGLPAAGKSTAVNVYLSRGYARLNRDLTGGKLSGLLPALDRLLGEGKRHVVLDNTYPSRATRRQVMEVAWRHGVPVRCTWLDTSIEDAQINFVERMLDAHGRLLTPEEIKQRSKKDPSVFGPNVQFRYRTDLEPPAPDEGFSEIEQLPFVRRRDPSRTRRALIVEVDGVLTRSRSGARAPISPDDVEVLPGRREVLDRHRAEGFAILAIAWTPEVAEGTLRAEEAAAIHARTRELLALDAEVAFCPHGAGPPICWCRKPLPGLGVTLIRAHGLDPAACLHVGKSAPDRTFAARLGFRYADFAELFR